MARSPGKQGRFRGQGVDLLMTVSTLDIWPLRDYGYNQILEFILRMCARRREFHGNPRVKSIRVWSRFHPARARRVRAGRERERDLIVARKDGWIFLVIAAGFGLAFVAGCDDKKGVIPIRYKRPAEVEIPASIRKLAVAEFESSGNYGEAAGTMAADEISALFDEYNHKYKRFEVYDRSYVRKILEEKQLQMMLSDPASVVKAGRFAGVDAMVVGRVTASGEDSEVSESYLDISTRKIQERMLTVRKVRVSVSMKLVSVKTGREYVTRGASEEYDSSDRKKGGAGGPELLGGGQPKLKDVQEAVKELLRECMRKLHGVISPHDVSVDVKLQPGRSEAVKSGTILADERNYKDALTYYLQAIKSVPDDHGAMFNAGVMYEVMGDLPNAEQMYGRAFGVHADKKYLVARSRVRMEQ